MSKPRGRRATCPHCGLSAIVRTGQVWKHKQLDASVQIIAPDKDGAVVEQTDRRGDRWGLSYRDLLAHYRKQS